MQFLKLLKKIVLTSVREDRFLTALSVLGVALGIGLFMGVNVATTRAVKSFETNIAALNPAFNYEISDLWGTGFREEVYLPVHMLEEQSVPLLSVNALIPDINESVNISGIYTAKAFPFIGKGSEHRPDMEHFLTTLNGVVVTKKFAEEHHFSKGNIFRAYVYNNEYPLTIVGILDRDGVSRNTLFMDLGNFQEYFGKTGYLTRIDLATDEKTADLIGRTLPAGLTIQKKEQVFENQKSLIDAFRFNLRFVTFLAVLVGVFLLYNTIFISVVKRRREIGILRGLGMGRKTVVALFTIQGMALGFAGSLLGIVFGQVSSWFSIAMVEKTMSRFYGSTGISASFITGKDAAATVALGLAVSFFASLVPALDAANIRPNETLREGTFEKQYKDRQRTYSLLGVLFILVSIAMTYVDYQYTPFHFPWLSYAAIVLFIAGCTFNSPVYLGIGLKVFKPLSHRLFKAPARIATGDISGSRYRFSVALMTVAVSSALIVAIVSSVYSLKASFVDWINDYITADFYIKPASCTSNFCFSPLPDEVAETVERLPGVEHVARFRALQVNFRGQTVIAGFGDSESLGKYRPKVGKEEKERMERLRQYREVSISDYLMVKYGLKRGNSIEIQTPKGKVAFTVNNTSISYSTTSGFIYFDRRWLKEYWGLDDAGQLSIYLAKNADRGKVIQTIEKGIGKKYALEVTDNDELRQSVLRIFDKSFALTYTIELIAILISLIGVVNALLILVFEKKREISVLRYLGASWQHIRLAMLISASIVGIAGILLGCVMGSAISMVITHVINKISFGWEVAFRIPFLPVALLMLLLFITTMAAGLAPSYLARKIDPKAFVSFE